MTRPPVPVVDMADYRDPTLRSRFLNQLGASLEQTGFVAIKNHPISKELLQRSYAAAAQVFALPVEVKRRCETPETGRQRGYTSFGVEHAKNHNVADLKEFWHVGRTVDAVSGEALSTALPSNLFPAEVPAYEQQMLALFKAMDAFSLLLLSAIAEYLGWDPDAFLPLVRQGNTVLRVIHYPPVPAGTPAGAVRAAAHEDINLITILPVSTQPGLELMNRAGDWLPVNPPAGVLLCDTGDMMKILTKGALGATTHRVVNPASGHNDSRYSMPFFVHPHPKAVLRDGLTAGAYLRQRLREIGVA